MSWRSNSNIILIEFTDEPGQSYLDPELRENDVVAALILSSLKVYIYSDPQYYGDFDSIAGSRLYDVNLSKPDMLQSLNGVLADICIN